MNPQWHSFLESKNAVFDNNLDELISFGDPAGELLAAAQQTIVVPLTHLGLLDAAGDDAKAFLHGQLTNDINHLGETQVQHAGWCSAKGRMQASFLVWREADHFLLALSDDLLEATQKRLQMYVLRAKVKIQAATDRLALGIAGPQAAQALADAGYPVPQEGMTVALANGSAIINLGATRFIVTVPVTAIAQTWQKIAITARPAGVPAWRWLDIQLAYPLVTLATKEEFVPQMADFEKIGGVSFHKGCYPGQEVVARTQYLGKVKRHLYRMKSQHAVKAGDILHSPDNPDQSCGMVMTVAPSPAGGFEALAVVQSNFADNVRLGALDGPTIQVTAVNPA